MATKKHGRKQKSDRVKDGEGDPCPRCGGVTQAWKHSDDWVPAPKKSYYSRWHECFNAKCVTTLIMPKQYRVFPSADKLRADDRTSPPSNPIVDSHLADLDAGRCHMNSIKQESCAPWETGLTDAEIERIAQRAAAILKCKLDAWAAAQKMDR
jgi:hypothetical protein